MSSFGNGRNDAGLPQGATCSFEGIIEFSRLISRPSEQVEHGLRRDGHIPLGDRERHRGAGFRCRLHQCLVQREVQIGVPSVDIREEGRVQVAEERRRRFLAHGQEVVEASFRDRCRRQSHRDGYRRRALPVEPPLELRGCRDASLDRVQNPLFIYLPPDHEETATLTDVHFVHPCARKQRNIAHSRLPPGQAPSIRLLVRPFDIDPDFGDAVEEQQERHIQIGERVHLPARQRHRLRRAQRGGDDRRIAASGIHGNLVRVVLQRTGDEVPRNGLCDGSARRSINTGGPKNVFDLADLCEAEAIAVEPIARRIAVA